LPDRPSTIRKEHKRYLKQVETDEVRQIPDDDEKQFRTLLAERLSNGRQAWVQTGSQDPAVDVVLETPVVVIETTAPALALAVDGDQTIGEAENGTVTKIEYVPEAAITGANTETRTLRVVNKGQAGVGTTVVGTLAFTLAVNGVAFDAKAYTLSATPADREVADGDVLVAVSTHSGSTGLADPGGQVRVTIDPAQV
jgi:hypothetical protein